MSRFGHKEINILLLSMTGVGKTTLINAFANYFVYDTLNEALENEMQCVIGSNFHYTNPDTWEDIKIVMKASVNEESSEKAGESQTRTCRSFVFETEQLRIRFIDTPGIGDTAGPDQDEKNLETILAHLSTLSYLHAICILMKSNIDRLTIEFRYCITEILRYLHISAQAHIMFVFTNAQSSNFQLERAAPLLKRIWADLKKENGIEIPFSQENSFLFDNEAFRYLALCNNGISFDEENRERYDRSWNRTIHEFKRMLSYIRRCQPYDVKGILSLNEAQKILRRLSRPIAEAIRNIEQNLQLVEQQLKEFQRNPRMNPTYLRQIDLKIEDLGHPRTVSINPKFMKAVKTENIVVIDYTSHCHERCFLTGVEQEVIGHHELRSCAAMNQSTGICNACGCEWKEHMHITYVIKPVENKMPFSTIQQDKNSVEDFMKKRIRDLETERKVIMNIYGEVAKFIHNNSLVSFNNAIVEYIELFIKEEKKKAQSGNGTLIEKMNETLQEYQSVKKLLEYKGQRNPPSHDPSCDVLMLKDQVEALQNLPLCGKLIRLQKEHIKHKAHEAVNQLAVKFKPTTSNKHSKFIREINSSTY